MIGNALNQTPMTPVLERFLQAQGALILDGGLATELEARGHDLDHPLWSARLLLSRPDEIYAVHLSYLKAGADCVTSASYQASHRGFAALGISAKRSSALLADSVRLAEKARDRLCEGLEPGRLRPLVAASIGPYGAFLADGSEYRGDYGVSQATLHAFHAPRWEVLAESDADLLACETLPSIDEAEVLLRLLEQTPDRPAWMSFSCRDDRTISDGTPIEACAALLKDCEQIAAVGVNCTAPGLIEPLITHLSDNLEGKPIIVYPNSGETYDPSSHAWTGFAEPLDFAAAAARWMRAGASLIGGCCRTGPVHIGVMRRALLRSGPG